LVPPRIALEQKGYGKMKPNGACAFCTLEWIFGRTASSLGGDENVELASTLLDVFSREFRGNRSLGRMARKALDEVYPQVLAAAAGRYDEIREKSNHAAKALLPAAEQFVQKGETPRDRFKRACFLASTGNISPLAAPSSGLKFAEAENLIAGGDFSPVMMGDVYETGRDKQRVLYLSDNAGEIGFDLLLIEQLKSMGATVTLVVKEEPFFEDATQKDALYFGLDKLCDRVLSVRTVFIPGEGSFALENALKESDLVISKGTFNFESLYEEGLGKPVIYLLKIKCGTLSRKLGVDQGRFVVRSENP
jgi:damage-control phosphatase, subfamily I